MSIRHHFPIAIACALSLTATAGSGQDTSKIVNELLNSQWAQELETLPTLAPFAVEWDAMAAQVSGEVAQQDISDYQMLSGQDLKRVKQSLSALSENKEAIEFLTDSQSMSSFNRVYEQAVKSDSPISLIPREKALQYWIVSRTVTTEPAIIRAFPNDPSQQWCLPPLISCTPFPPTVEE